MNWPIFCGLIFLLVAVISVLELMRKAPGAWECPRCAHEVIGVNVCPWCGYVSGDSLRLAPVPGNSDGCEKCEPKPGGLVHSDDGRHCRYCGRDLFLSFHACEKEREERGGAITGLANNATEGGGVLTPESFDAGVADLKGQSFLGHRIVVDKRLALGEWGLAKFIDAVDREHLMNLMVPPDTRRWVSKDEVLQLARRLLAEEEAERECPDIKRPGACPLGYNPNGCAKKAEREQAPVGLVGSHKAGKAFKAFQEFTEKCEEGVSIEYHGLEWVAMSKARYDELFSRHKGAKPAEEGLREALATIGAGTTDKNPPWRCAPREELMSYARHVLERHPAKAEEPLAVVCENNGYHVVAAFLGSDGKWYINIHKWGEFDGKEQFVGDTYPEGEAKARAFLMGLPDREGK